MSKETLTTKVGRILKRLADLAGRVARIEERLERLEARQVPDDMRPVSPPIEPWRPTPPHDREVTLYGCPTAPQPGEPWWKWDNTSH